MTRIRYANRARLDLAEIHLYHEEYAGVDVARDNVAKIRATIRHTLRIFPRSGRLRPEFGEHVRSYPVLAYVVFYAIDPRGVRILRILHGHRDIRAPLMSLLTAV